MFLNNVSSFNSIFVHAVNKMYVELTIFAYVLINLFISPCNYLLSIQLITKDFKLLLLNYYVLILKNNF